MSQQSEILIYNARPDRPFKQSKRGDSGFDLYANTGVERTIDPGRRWTVPAGIHLAMPVGVEAQTRGRSGLARDHGVVIVPGTIDSGYRGEIGITLINLGHEAWKFCPGDRIAQLVFASVIVPDVMSETDVPGEAERFNAMMYVEGYFGRPGPSRFRHVSSLAELPPSERGASGFGSTGR